MPCVSVSKGNDHSIGCQIAESGQRICRKTGLSLFTVGDDGGASIFEARDGVTEGRLLGSLELFARNLTRRMVAHRRQQGCGARDASDWFGRYRHDCASRFSSQTKNLAALRSVSDELERRD